MDSLDNVAVDQEVLFKKNTQGLVDHFYDGLRLTETGKKDKQDAGNGAESGQGRHDLEKGHKGDAETIEKGPQEAGKENANKNEAVHKNRPSRSEEDEQLPEVAEMASEKNTNTEEEETDIVDMEVAEPSDEKDEKDEKEKKGDTKEHDSYSNEEEEKRDETDTMEKGPHGKRDETEKAREDETGENNGPPRLEEKKKIPEGAVKASEKNTNTEADGIIDIVQMEVTEPGKETEGKENERGTKEHHSKEGEKMGETDTVEKGPDGNEAETEKAHEDEAREKDRPSRPEGKEKLTEEEEESGEKNTNTEENGIIDIVGMEVTEPGKEKEEKESKPGTNENDWHSKDGGKGGEAETVTKVPDRNEAETDKAHEDELGENDRPSRPQGKEQLTEEKERSREKNNNTEKDGIIDIAEMKVTDPGKEKEEKESKRGTEERDWKSKDGGNGGEAETVQQRFINRSSGPQQANKQATLQAPLAGIRFVTRPTSTNVGPARIAQPVRESVQIEKGDLPIDDDMIEALVRLKSSPPATVCQESVPIPAATDKNEAETEHAHEDETGENDRPSQLEEKKKIPEGAKEASEINSNTEEDGIIDIVETEVTEPGDEKDKKENKRGTEEAAAAASEKNTNTEEDRLIEMEVTEPDKEKEEKESKCGTEERGWNSKDGGEGGEAETVRKGPGRNEAETDMAHEDESGENDRPSRPQGKEQLTEEKEKSREKNNNTEEDGIIDTAEMKVTEPGEENED